MNHLMNGLPYAAESLMNGLPYAAESLMNGLPCEIPMILSLMEQSL